MLKVELAELIRNGENSGVEFKRDDLHPDSLAKEMAALLNLEGGHILPGSGSMEGKRGKKRRADSVENER